VNLPEMIVPTFGEYASRAIELANNQKKYELIKKKLVSNLPNAPLFNTAKFVKNLESAYIRIYDNQHQGLGPDHVYIEDLNDEK
jgi:predicted O-linked N-acetylglucosamine transferase (SPINDLY family)